MKAVVLHEYGGPEKLKYEDFSDPGAGEGEVLIRVASTSVNPIDYKMRSGEAQASYPVHFPGILGRDVSGIVRSVGPKVKGFEPGDHVMALAWKAYAELAVVKAQDLVKVPAGLDLVEASSLPLVTTTGEQLITRGVRIKAGQTVLVSGALGGVGRTAVYVAKKAGATVLAGIRRSQMKQAAALNADEVIAIDEDKELEKIGFLDAVADAVGHETAQKLLPKVKQGGVFASVLGVPANSKLHPTVCIEAVWAEPDSSTLRQLAEDVVAGRFRIPIDRMLPLADASEAHAAAEHGGIGKVLLLA